MVRKLVSHFAPNYRLDVVELIPVNDTVVAAVDHRGIGRRSGVEVTTRYYNAYWIRQHKIVRLELYRERSEALQAVGLSGYACRRRGHDDLSVVTRDG